VCGVLVLHIVRKTVVRSQTLAFVINLYETVCGLQVTLLLLVLIQTGIPVLLIRNMKDNQFCCILAPSTLVLDVLY
jgi:hypothetical protein